jgi:hypothetical protein
MENQLKMYIFIQALMYIFKLAFIIIVSLRIENRRIGLEKLMFCQIIY